MAYVSLATYVVSGSPDPTIVFSSIPSSYKDLVLIVRSKTEQTSQSYFSIRFNGNTETLYSHANLNVGSGLSSQAYTFNRVGMPSMQPNTWANINTVNILDYAASNKHKTCLYKEGIQTSTTSTGIVRWGRTDPITSITVFLENGQSFSINSRFSLYGVV